MFGVSSLPRTLDAAKRDAAHPRRHVRLSVVKDLGLLVRRGAGEETTAAEQLLMSIARRDTEPFVRGAATVTLADHPGPAVLESLLLASEDEHPYVVEMALVGLRDVAAQGHKGACRVIKLRSKDERPALRFQAVLAAGRVLEDDAFSKLVSAALQDADAKVRYVACRVCDERFAGALPEAVEQALTRALEDPDAYVPVAAAFVLAPRGNVNARQVLSHAINRRLELPAPEDQQTLVELIGELGIEEGKLGLRAHARGRFGLVPGKFAWQAQIALARLGDDWAIGQLSRNLRHRNADVRVHAATAVGAARLKHLRPLIVELGQEQRIPAELVAIVLSELEQ